MKKRLFTIITIIWIIIFMWFISYIKLWVYNPFMSIYWYTQITFFDKNFVKLQDNPKIYIANPNPKDNSSLNVLIDYIENKWYEYLEDQRMASLLIFRKKDNDYIIHVNFKTNKYYTLWTNFTKLIK